MTELENKLQAAKMAIDAELGGATGELYRTLLVKAAYAIIAVEKKIYEDMSNETHGTGAGTGRLYSPLAH